MILRGRCLWICIQCIIYLSKLISYHQVISSSGGQIIAVQNPALALSESLSRKASSPSNTEATNPQNKNKKDELSSSTLMGTPFPNAGVNGRDSSGNSSQKLPHLQPASSAYRHAYSMNNASLMENTSAVATLLNLSRRDAARQAVAAAAALAVSSNSVHDKNYTLGHIASDRESPSSSSSIPSTTSSGYPRPKRSRMSKSNGDETFTDNETANREDMEKDKEDACDIDENFLGEVKQEPMSPPRSDSLSLEASSISASTFSYSATPLTRSSRSKLKNE